MRLDEKEFLTRLGQIAWRLGWLATSGRDTTVDKLRGEIWEMHVELQKLVSLAKPEYDMVSMAYEALKYISRYTPQPPSSNTRVVVAEKVEDKEDASND